MVLLILTMQISSNPTYIALLLPARVRGKPSSSPCRYADGCFRTSAKACSRVASAGLFAVAALFSNDGAMLFNFASLLLLMCELSAF